MLCYDFKQTVPAKKNTLCVNRDFLKDFLPSDVRFVAAKGATTSY